MNEAEKQRARVDALIAWTEDKLEQLNDYGTGAVAYSELVFPDPYPTPDAPESKPRRKARTKTEGNQAASRAFLAMEDAK
ncbi:hypothetical protein [Streptomyces europaeiscabiei]|uniref:hypothetical protein n=1 Tax=Streptomyces europaeiscabiei TaxID=146819 RepID=UPI0029A28172|nr:hypothetical protein [Streptomyces europaeiscabiei]MDX2772279.1 hypothetical protein [Streptomyces europaeiscabiei]